MLRLQTAWARAVGTPLSEVARLRACHGSRLVVEVPDAQWKREMERIAPRILERLAREVPCAPVAALCFSVHGGAAGRTGPPAPARTGAPGATTAGIPEGLGPVLARVGDESLRGRLEGVMGRYLSRAIPAR
jgi:hypothetical protein